MGEGASRVGAPAPAVRDGAGARVPVRGPEQASEVPAPLIEAPVAASFVTTGDARSRGAGSVRRRSLLRLQRTAGNRAVTAAVDRVVQRVPVSVKTGETLYNQAAAGGQAGAKHYGGRTRTYDLARNGDSGVTATVKIKFLSQARNTVPKPAGAPPGTPELGQLIGTPSEIPAGDERRTWAADMAREAVRSWNGKLVLVGEEVNLFSANTKKRLPVTFVATPVFGAGDDAHSTVIVHPPAAVGGSTGHPIDAGNWYQKKDDSVYPASDAIIYAHEYGHLLGIADEYSQSNEQMNALLHEAAPGNAASAMAALDRATIERMTLAALSRPLRSQLDAVMPQVTDSIRAKRPLVKAAMSKAARDAAASGTVRDALRIAVAAGTEGRLGPRIPQVVAFQTTTNFSARSLAAEGVEAGFAARALSTQIRDAYRGALDDPHSQTVGVRSLGDVRIRVHGSINAAAASGATGASASGVATSTIGPAARPGLPAVAPSGSLLAQLEGLPATWEATGSTLETGITPEIFATRMAAALIAAGAATILALALPTPGGAPARASTMRAVYQAAHELVRNAARTTAQQLATDLVARTIRPTLTASVTSLQGAISSELAGATSASPSALAAAPADPNMAAVVAAMKSRLDAAKAATAGTGRDPLGTPGGTAPAQDVTYSYQGLMGSNRTAEVRADQFSTLVQGFNDKLKKVLERAFTAEVK